MNRLATAYSLEKMRKALNEFRNSLATRKEAQKAAYARNNLTQNLRNENIQKKENKQTGYDIDIKDGRWYIVCMYIYMCIHKSHV